MICKVAHFNKTNKITLVFKDNGKVSYEETQKGNITIFLGKPIIIANFNDISNNESRIKYKNILKYWIQQDQENIDRKTVGFDLVISPTSYTTNILPSDTLRIDGNFLSQKESGYKISYNSTMMLYLSNEIHLAAKDFDKDKFEQLYYVAESILKKIQVYKYAFEYFKTAVFAGKKRTQSTIVINWTDSDGNMVVDPNIQITG